MTSENHTDGCWWRSLVLPVQCEATEPKTRAMPCANSLTLSTLSHTHTHGAATHVWLRPGLDESTGHLTSSSSLAKHAIIVICNVGLCSCIHVCMCFNHRIVYVLCWNVLCVGVSVCYTPVYGYYLVRTNRLENRLTKSANHCMHTTSLRPQRCFLDMYKCIACME